MFKNFFFAAGMLLVVSSVLFSACNKTSDVGLDLIPDKYIMEPGTQDTFKIEAFTYKIDSIITSGIAKGVLGTYIDPVFGSVNASFFTEMRPSVTLTKGTDPVFDSIVLYLKFDTLVTPYGKSTVDQEIRVYESTKRLFFDSTYYSNFNPEILNPQPIGSSVYNPKRLKDQKLIIKKDTVKNLLAVKLNHDFGKRLFDESDIWQDTSFVAYFKGLYIKSNSPPVDGSLAAFNLIDPYSKVVIYFKNSKDTTSASFNFSTICTRINFFQHQHNAPGFLPDLSNPEKKQDSVVYVQGVGGLKIKVKFPGLDKLKERGNYIVNKAELVIPVASVILTQETDYYAPNELYLKRINEKGEEAFLDEFIAGADFNDYIGFTKKDGKYFVDITYLVQKIVKGDYSNNGIIIMPRDAYHNPARVVLHSGKHSNRMRLQLSLTKI
jgi:hypothetical protein